ncbi:LpqB family beta-propeller domain-containing protein [Allosaccharopolyspora coralli]|uniref:LpqB family beta-propeller domain-containing protein n=1 Tax=Allosaccharopolyspora coralli TaxID=2665642 RepID=UPI001E5D21B5|nr:LpqB family beta-propeller domain-containing protein [Allosaccharopolyspora coralli]
MGRRTLGGTMTDTGSGGRRLRTLVAVVVAMFVLASCAAIPEASDPEAIKRVDEANTPAEVPAPPEDVDPLALVRNFADAAGSPANDYEAARLHLTRQTREQWQPPRELLIVDEVDTIPQPPPPGAPRSVQMVSLQVDKVGRLKADKSFVPESGSYEVPVRVEMQPNGQWRIANPPPELLVSRSAFEDNYRPVPVYFLDHTRDGVVPDQRYVVAQPGPAQPSRVIELLNGGPSEGFRGAMDTALPPDAVTKTNVSEAEDGALVVNFSDLGRPAPEVRRLIAAQVVLSLQGVSNARVRLLEDGTPLLPDTPELRPADVAQFESDNGDAGASSGLAVVDERLRVLDDNAAPVPGPAGSGEYDVVRAGQSADGSRLAAAVRRPGGVGLRVGEYGGTLQELPIGGVQLTEPTWRGSSQVWTVVDSRRIAYAVQGRDGNWSTGEVDSAELAGDRPITDLRISRDGTRLAAVVDGTIVVAGIVGDAGDLRLYRPTPLTGGPSDVTITGVEWIGDDSLVAMTSSSGVPVLETSVDGFQWSSYSSANLQQPLTAITVGPGRKVVVADNSGLWQATGDQDLWRLLQVPIGGGSIPFFPG